MTTTDPEAEARARARALLDGGFEVVGPQNFLKGRVLSAHAVATIEDRLTAALLTHERDLAAAREERDAALATRDVWCREASRSRDHIERLRTIVDEAFGMRPVESVDETLTALEAAVLDREMEALKRVLRLELALGEAAQSLETVSRWKRGKDEADGVLWDVKQYATSRATVARAALAHPGTTDAAPKAEPHVCKCANEPCPVCGGGPSGEWSEGSEVKCDDCGTALYVAVIEECKGRTVFELSNGQPCPDCDATGFRDDDVGAHDCMACAAEGYRALTLDEARKAAGIGGTTDVLKETTCK